MSTETITARGSTSATGAGYRLEVDAKLYRLQGNQESHFSLTGDLMKGQTFEAGGCLHDLICRVFPALRPVALVHLSSPSGTPMHAEANALYWAGFSPAWPRVKDGEPWRQMAPDNDYGRRELETDAEGLIWAPATLAKHLRVSIEEAREIRAYCANDETQHYSAAMHFQCQMLRARWQEQADEALRVIRDMPDPRRAVKSLATWYEA